ncbi:hypothetical protein P3686_23545, partial [Vibrio parahaemolyticus]|nr:hypothetical protein [Vibrio parahaemolyticus]
HFLKGLFSKESKQNASANTVSMFSSSIVRHEYPFRTIDEINDEIKPNNFGAAYSFYVKYPT